MTSLGTLVPTLLEWFRLAVSIGGTDWIEVGAALPDNREPHASNANCIETRLEGGAFMKCGPPTLREIGIDLAARAFRTFSRDDGAGLVHGCCRHFQSGIAFKGTELERSDLPNIYTGNAFRSAAAVAAAKGAVTTALLAPRGCTQSQNLECHWTRTP